MGLWGTDADSTANKPKNLTTDTNSDYAKKDVFANNMGWVRRAGTAANGNDNADAQEEVLVAIGDLSGASSTTGLKHLQYHHVDLLLVQQQILTLQLTMQTHK